MKSFGVFVLFIALAHCDVFVNKLFDAELANIGNILRKFHVKYVTLGDITVSDDIKASNVKLGDISRIVRKGDATSGIEGNSITSQGAVGIDKLDLLMDTLELKGKTYRKVLVVVGSNMLSFKSNIYSTKTACNQTYSGLRLSRIDGVMLYSRPSLKMNITSLFIKEVVPFVNRKLSSPSVLRTLIKYLDSCRPHSESVVDWLRDTSSSESSNSSDETFTNTDESAISNDNEKSNNSFQLKVEELNTPRPENDLKIDIVMV